MAAFLQSRLILAEYIRRCKSIQVLVVPAPALFGGGACPRTGQSLCANELLLWGGGRSAAAAAGGGLMLFAILLLPLPPGLVLSAGHLHALVLVLPDLRGAHGQRGSRHGRAGTRTRPGQRLCNVRERKHLSYTCRDCACFQEEPPICCCRVVVARVSTTGSLFMMLRYGDSCGWELL